MLTSLHWVEKHRPRSIEQLALEGDTRKLLRSYIEAGEIPHLLLIGPPGSGKTTVARILIDNLDCRAMSLNASVERGINMVRDKVGSFVTAEFGPQWNIVFFDEADAMTSDAQTGLRNLVENYSDRSRFIFSGNYPHRIIDALHSRCQVITMGRPPLKERYKVLAQVLQSEGIEFEPPVALAYAERYPDMRRMLSSAQRAWFTAGGEGYPLPAVDEKSDTSGTDIFELLKKKHWAGLKHLSSSGNFDPQEGLRALFWSVPDDHPKVSSLRHIIGKGVHDSGHTPDPVILFLGVCAEAMLEL